MALLFIIVVVVVVVVTKLIQINKSGWKIKNGVIVISSLLRKRKI